MVEGGPVSGLPCDFCNLLRLKKVLFLRSFARGILSVIHVFSHNRDSAHESYERNVGCNIPSMFLRSFFTILLCVSSSSILFALSIMLAPSISSDHFPMSVSVRNSLVSSNCFLS